MRIRRAIQRHIFRLQKVSAPVTLLLLVLNLSLTITSLAAWRGIHPYFITAISVLVISVVVLIFANIYTVVMKMHIAERRAFVDHDPYQIYAFQPFQVAVTLNQMVPMMRAVAKLSGDEELLEKAEKMERWAKQGYISKDE